MKYTYAAPLLAVLFLSSCVSRSLLVDRTAGTESGEREEISRSAMSYLGRRDIESAGEGFRNDCSGFVLGVYRLLGFHVDISSGYYSSEAEALYRELKSRGLVYRSGIPGKSDVVFFRNTTGRGGNVITHIGMVADVLDGETVLIVHYSSKGVTRLRMNLTSPHVYRDENGVVLNDYLKKAEYGNRYIGLLSGELFCCYGDLYTFLRKQG